METNFEMVDVARLAETLSYFYMDAQKVEMFTKPQH
jgi:hypothetical protein